MDRRRGGRALPLTEAGEGPRVVFVHGSVVGAQRTWRHQAALAEHWTVCFADRPGFGGRPPLERGDFELEAPGFAELLGDGAHLVGHSYGAVIALHVAALTPSAVRSLTVSEPGCWQVAAGDPAVDAAIAGAEAFYSLRPTLTPIEMLRLFRAGVNSAHETPDELEGELLDGARMLLTERAPWEGDTPLDEIAAAGIPALVISGGHSPVFETICDTIATRLHAQRSVIPGRGHTIPSTGAPYNERLHAFLSACERDQGSDPVRRAR
jgi:pimeloyl-ACP methyl ester carboxylesterase